jgi:hypothetical protein
MLNIICKGKTLPPIESIWRYELRGLLGERHLLSPFDGGKEAWVGHFDLDVSRRGIQKEINESLRELGSGLDRQQRRSIKNTFLKSGVPTGKLIPLMAEAKPKMFKEMKQKYPFLENSSLLDKFYEFIIGQFPGKRLGGLIVQELSNPEIFVKYFFGKYEEASSFVGHFLDLENKIYDIIRQYRIELNSIAATSAELKKHIGTKSYGKMGELSG